MKCDLTIIIYIYIHPFFLVFRDYFIPKVCRELVGVTFSGAGTPEIKDLFSFCRFVSTLISFFNFKPPRFRCVFRGRFPPAHRQTDGRTNRRRGRQTHGQIGGQTDRRTDRQTDRQTDRLTERRADRRTDRQTARKAGHFPNGFQKGRHGSYFYKGGRHGSYF